MAFLLAACTSGTTGAPAPEPVVSALATTLSRVPTAALGSAGHFEFGDSVKLNSLAAGDKLWKFERYDGAGSVSSLGALTGDAIGADLGKATALLTVGQPPNSMVLVVGGQNQQTVTAAAKKSGWSGTDILSRTPDLSSNQPGVANLSIFVAKIRPIGNDVVLSQSGGDPAGISLAGASPSSPADQTPAVQSVTNCLGDVPLAMGTGINTAVPADLTAVGAGPGASGTASAVICLGATDVAAANTLADKVRTALASGKSKATQRPWTELLQSATVDVLSGTPAVVRIKASTSTATLVVQMLGRLDLPGR